MITAIKPQITAFLQGFWELVPKRLISIFNSQELELLISGLLDINKADLKAHTEYTGYPASPGGSSRPARTGAEARPCIGRGMHGPGRGGSGAASSGAGRWPSTRTARG